MKNKKVFLGGTCNGSQWRAKIKQELNIDWFDPVVEDWTPECQEEEIRQRKTCDYCLYTITPAMTGFYSIAEVIDDSNKRPDKTILVVLDEDGDYSFNYSQLKSLQMVKRMVQDNGGTVWETLEGAAEYMNTKK